MVIAGIVESIETAKRDGVGAWQIQAVQRGYEMLGRYLGMFKEQVDVSLDDKLMERLIRGRRRAAGLPEGEEEEEEPQDDSSQEPKPN